MIPYHALSNLCRLIINRWCLQCSASQKDIKLPMSPTHFAHKCVSFFVTGSHSWLLNTNRHFSIFLRRLWLYSIVNFSFGGLFFHLQIWFSFRLTITSFLKEFSAMKHLNSVSTFFAKITDSVKNKKWRINFFLNIWISQSGCWFRMTQSTCYTPIKRWPM